MVCPNWITAIVVATALGAISGCRTIRPEVPPPPQFASDGRKLGSNLVGFGSAPRAGYMVDASTQTAPGMASPGGDQSSIASRNAPSGPSSAGSSFPTSTPATTPGTPLATPSSGQLAGMPKSRGVGGIFSGIGSSAKPKKDSEIVTAGNTEESPPVTPLDPPVSLPPPPLVPPPSGVAPPALEIPKETASQQSPSALPPESAIPPLVPERIP